jgi:N6-L-threonylcarbamoyladenine synthase
MIILSIETSCDETALTLIDATGDAKAPRFKVLGNALHSQVETHAEFGGVFPSLAKREHAKNMVPLFASCIEHAKEHPEFTTTKLDIPEERMKAVKEILVREEGLADAFLKYVEEYDMPDIDAIAVTTGPGLEPALWVGISFAKALSLVLDKPIVPINHMEGHIVSVIASNDETVEFPALALLISGGHTELVEIENWHKYKVLGATKDDAVGEAFDKVARLLNLPYPGGPKISKLAAQSRTENIAAKLEKETGAKPWDFPRPMIKSDNFDFSFSGLKTSVLYAVKKKTDEGKAELTNDEQVTLAEEFENAVTEVLVEKTRKALEHTNAKTLILGGGVIANTYIRKNFEKLAINQDVKLFVPSVDLSTDNSVMIGVAGYLRYINEPTSLIPPGGDIKASGNLSINS